MYWRLTSWSVDEIAFITVAATSIESGGFMPKPRGVASVTTSVSSLGQQSLFKSHVGGGGTVLYSGASVHRFAPSVYVAEYSVMVKVSSVD